MSDSQPETQEQAMTAAEAAKRVFRIVPVLDEKTQKPTKRTKKNPVAESEVLSFKDCGGYVVVVTTDGQKLTDKEVE